MNDDPVPSLFVFLFGYGGFAVVSLLLLLAINWLRHSLTNIVEDDGEYQ